MPELNEILQGRRQEEANGGRDEQNHHNLLDLLKDDKNLPKLSQSKLLLVDGQNDVLPPGINSIHNYLAIRDQEENERSYFKAGAAFVLRKGRTLFGHKDAVSEFDAARERGDNAGMVKLLRQDREQRRQEDGFGSYSGAALKTGFLFGGGKIGAIGLTAVTTSDAAKPHDQFSKQALDAVLGAGKGIATTIVFNKIVDTNWSPLLKGWTVGMSNTLINTGLTSNNYINREGEVDFAFGAKKTLSSVFSPDALIVDGSSIGASFAALKPIDSYFAGALFKNPVTSKLVIAAVSGLTDGSLAEVGRQKDDPKYPSTNWLEVAKKGGEKAALDTISALPGANGMNLPRLRSK
ncbi:MAG: hypothetical protein K2X27_09795 [Candidatus Obscuribacterales bacterium]|nr:hypothetical protein [Candidatus Obscuribacterales bacterium]